jgi:ankyrin repeat protein
LASQTGYLMDIFILLCENKADVTLVDIRGQTALHHAAKYGHMNAVELLVNCGAKIDVQDVFGATPIFYANDLENIEKFVQFG